MSDNTYSLLRYIAGGLGVLIFCGLIAYCHLEELRLKKSCASCPPCEVRK
jgi:hypothetical protein